MCADATAVITAEANRSDRAKCTAIHATRAMARRLHGLDVVIDDSVPFPGYEIHRAAP